MTRPIASRAVSFVAVVVTVCGVLTATTTASTAVPARTVPKPASISITPAQRAAVASSMKRQIAAERAHSSVSRVAHLDPELAASAVNAKGTVSVNVAGAAAQIVGAVSRAGGTVLAATSTDVSAVVPADQLDALAGSAGVQNVSKPVRGYSDGVISQGVAASNANTWQTAGQQGAGVKIGIVDGGYANLATEAAAGNLPTGQTVFGQHCADVNSSNHGTAVAELIHQMAPAAQLVLECVDDSVSFQTAGTELAAQGVKVVNSSLTFPGDSRGDGTGSSTSTATTVKTARQAGILWIQSAGNNGLDHVGGTLNSDVDFAVTFPDGYNTDIVKIAPGGSAEAVVQWDQWPTSNIDIVLAMTEIDNLGNQVGQTQFVEQSPGTSPVLGICFAPNGAGGCANSSAIGSSDSFVLQIGTPSNVPALRYDLSYLGDVSPDIESCTDEQCTAYRTSPQSVTEPASSPYALAVGAADFNTSNNCQSDVTTTGTAGKPIENFSAQGPTIDGRVKPDILGYDGVTSNLNIDGGGTTFCGTSAAAPYVAGAAAEVLGANPALDASQVQSFLEQHANSGAPNNPPTNAAGHGVLTLGAATTPSAPVGSGYTPLAAPVRVLDTRPSQGGSGALAPGAAVNQSVAAAGVPNTATAVAINLTGVLATTTGATVLAAYPGNSTFPGTSNLNLASPADATAAVFAVVTLGTGSTIAVHNIADGSAAYAIVDVVGYFSASGAGQYGALAPQRILDTRFGTGGHTGQIADGQAVTVTPGGLPAGTTSVVVNVTAAATKGFGLFTAAPTDPHSNATSTINFAGFDRANLAVVGLNNGSFVIRGSGASADAIVDLVGYFSPNGTSRYVPLPSPTRIVDTRFGNGGYLAPLGQGTKDIVFAAGLNGVPHNATAVLTGLVAVPTGASFFTVYANNGQLPPTASNLNFTPARNVPNAVIANLGGTPESAVIYNDSGAANAVMDLFGYFA